MGLVYIIYKKRGKYFLKVLRKEFISGVLAGVLIAVGGTVYLSCPDRIVGSFLFSIALLCICLENFFLYTGKICYLPENANKSYARVLLFCFFGNLVSAVSCATLLKWTHISLNKAANLMCIDKLNKSIGQTLLDAFFCGILIYLAVNIYKNKRSLVGILIGIPVFILCGFEHCIVDIFYFSLSDSYISSHSFGFLFIAVAGNSLGGIFIPVIKKLNTV